MPRGGRRPGAGAPKGNLNALRTGTRSKQLKAVIIALMAIPQTRRVLLHFSRMEQHRRARLAQAINRYARLASVARPELVEGSRERSIKAVQRQQIRSRGQFSGTTKDRPSPSPAPQRPRPTTRDPEVR